MKLFSYLKCLFSRPKPPALSGKTLVLFADGRVALANNPDHAQAIVIGECMTSGNVVMADFRPATLDEVAAITAK